MPTAIPQSVRQVLGDPASDDFAHWITQTIQEQAVPRDEYREVLSRLDVVETRLGGVERGLSDLRGEMLDQRREMNERFDRVNERFDQMNERLLVQTRWTVGTIALFGTIVTLLIAIAELAP